MKINGAVKMKPEIKRAWVEALRSGDYEQGKNSLNSGGKLCCLGVLCELAVKAGVLTKEATGDGWYVTYGGADVMPPTEIYPWLGLTEREDFNVLSFVGPDDNIEALPVFNDKDGLTFAQIADIIEEQL